MGQETKDAADSLRHIPLFAGAPAPAMARAAARATWLTVGPGHLVLDFDDSTTDVVFVVEGVVRVSLQTASGDHIRILGDVRAGEFVGEMSAIDGAPRSARVETLVRARLCLLPADAFLAAAAEVPAIGLRIMRLLSSRVRTQTRQLLETTALPTRLRIAAELLRIGRGRPDGSVVISPPPTQQDLANRIGARRETVSRELGSLGDAGLLRRTQGAYVLPDPTALHAAVQRGMDRPEG